MEHVANGIGCSTEKLAGFQFLVNGRLCAQPLLLTAGEVDDCKVVMQGKGLGGMPTGDAAAGDEPPDAVSVSVHSTTPYAQCEAQRILAQLQQNAVELGEEHNTMQVPQLDVVMVEDGPVAVQVGEPDAEPPVDSQP